ncbi:hypothetical protein BDV3_006776 [Batrachochytrium dendrobatidis]
MDSLKNIAEQLQLQISDGTISKAEELKRRAEARGPVALLGSIYYNADPRLLGTLCLHIACERSLENFVDVITVAKYLRIKIPQYRQLNRQLSEKLAPTVFISGPFSIKNSPSSRTAKLKKMMVQFGCTQIHSQVELLHHGFKTKYSASLGSGLRSTVDWYSDDIANAVFFSACSAAKISIPKIKRDSEGASTKLAVKYIEFIKSNCGPELDAIRAHVSKIGSAGQTPSKPALEKSVTFKKNGLVDHSNSMDIDQELPIPPSAPTSDENHGIQTPTRHGLKRSPLKILNQVTKKTLPVASKTAAPQRPRRHTGINNLVQFEHIKTTRKYKQYMAWRASLLEKLVKSHDK